MESEPEEEEVAAYEEEDEDVYSEEERAASSKLVSEKMVSEKVVSEKVVSEKVKVPEDRYEANESPDYGGEESSAKPSKLESLPNESSKQASVSQRQPPAVQSQKESSVGEDVPDYSDEDEYKDDE